MSARAGMYTWCVMVVCAGLSVQAQPAQTSAPHFVISGTSTVRGWSCPAEGVVTITPGTSGQPVPGFPQGVQTVAVTIPVTAIACEEPDMREHLRETLNEKTYPEIVYQLEQYTLAGTDTASMTGSLTIAGVTQPVAFNVKLTPSPEGVRGVGETSVDMTQFSVTPPTLWLGMLKVGKDVRVRFDVVLPPSPSP